MLPSPAPLNQPQRTDVQGEGDLRALQNCGLFERLPQDILHRIFLACLPTNLAAEDLLTESPWNISQVCQSWRSIALLSPGLWAHFQLHAFNAADFDSGWAFERMKRWTNLSKDALLTVSLEIEDGRSPQTDRIVRCLLDEGHRWKTIQMTMLTSSALWPVSSIRCQTSLQHLALRGAALGSPRNDLRVLMDDSQPPNLRSMKIVGRFSLVTNAGGLPDLQNLQYIPTNLQAGGSFLSLLRSASSIVELDTSLNIMPTPDAQTMVVLPRLRRLALDCKGFRVDQASFFFDNVVFPSLSALRLRVCNVSGNVSTWAAIGGACRRSNPPLQAACFIAVPGKVEGVGAYAFSDECVQGFTNLLRAMNQLTQLEVYEALVTNTLLDELAAQVGSEASICPKLKSLALGCPWLPFLSESPIIGLVTSRWRLKSRSFKLSMRCKMAQPHIVHTLEAAEVKECVAQGLVLVIN